MRNADAPEQFAEDRLKAVVITPYDRGIADIFIRGRAEVEYLAHRASSVGSGKKRPVPTWFHRRLRLLKMSKIPARAGGAEEAAGKSAVKKNGRTPDRI